MLLEVGSDVLTFLNFGIHNFKMLFGKLLVLVSVFASDNLILRLDMFGTGLSIQIFFCLDGVELRVYFTVDGGFVDVAQESDHLVLEKII